MDPTRTSTSNAQWPNSVFSTGLKPTDNHHHGYPNPSPTNHYISPYVSSEEKSLAQSFSHLQRQVNDMLNTSLANIFRQNQESELVALKADLHKSTETANIFEKDLEFAKLEITDLDQQLKNQVITNLSLHKELDDLKSDTQSRVKELQDQIANTSSIKDQYEQERGQLATALSSLQARFKDDFEKANADVSVLNDQLRTLRYTLDATKRYMIIQAGTIHSAEKRLADANFQLTQNAQTIKDLNAKVSEGTACIQKAEAELELPRLRILSLEVELETVKADTATRILAEETRTRLAEERTIRTGIGLANEIAVLLKAKQTAAEDTKAMKAKLLDAICKVQEAEVEIDGLERIATDDAHQFEAAKARVRELEQSTADDTARFAHRLEEAKKEGEEAGRAKAVNDLHVTSLLEQKSIRLGQVNHIEEVRQNAYRDGFQAGKHGTLWPSDTPKKLITPNGTFSPQIQNAINAYEGQLKRVREEARAEVEINMLKDLGHALAKSTPSIDAMATTRLFKIQIDDWRARLVKEINPPIPTSTPAPAHGYDRLASGQAASVDKKGDQGVASKIVAVGEPVPIITSHENQSANGTSCPVRVSISTTPTYESDQPTPNPTPPPSLSNETEPPQTPQIPTTSSKFDTLAIPRTLNAKMPAPSKTDTATGSLEKTWLLEIGETQASNHKQASSTSNISECKHLRTQETLKNPVATTPNISVSDNQASSPTLENENFETGNETAEPPVNFATFKIPKKPGSKKPARLEDLAKSTSKSTQLQSGDNPKTPVKGISVRADSLVFEMNISEKAKVSHSGNKRTVEVKGDEEDDDDDDDLPLIRKKRRIIATHSVSPPSASEFTDWYPDESQNSLTDSTIIVDSGESAEKGDDIVDKFRSRLSTGGGEGGKRLEIVLVDSSVFSCSGEKGREEGVIPVRKKGMAIRGRSKKRY